MNTFLILPGTAMRYAPDDARREGPVALPSPSSVDPQGSATTRPASNQADFDGGDGSADIDMRWIPLLVPLLAGLMAALFFLVGWLGLALPLAQH